MKIVAVVLIVTFAVAPVAAQSAVNLGEKVRISTQDHGQFIGKLVASDPDSIRIDKGGELGWAVIPRGLIRRVEIGIGKDRGKAARTGAVVGLGIAAVFSFGLAIGPFQSGRGSFSERSRLFIPWSVLTVPIPTVIGALYGTDRWAPANLTVPAGQPSFSPSISLRLPIRF